MYLVAAQHQRGFGLVPQLLHGQHAVHVDQLLEMPRDAFELLRHIAAQRGRYFHMMTAEIKLHEAPP